MINLKNLQYNFINIRNFVGPKAQVISVVKANGYGMGIPGSQRL